MQAPRRSAGTSHDRHGQTVSVSTIRRVLWSLLDSFHPSRRSDRSRPTSGSKQTLPNECWQSDFTHWRLADRTDAEILVWLDDHSRYALSRHRAPAGHWRRSWSTPSTQPPQTQGFPGVGAHRQRAGVHDPLRWWTRWPQPARDQPRCPGHHAETLTAEPPDHLRKGRTFPPDTQEVARRPTHRPATLGDLQTLLRHLRRRLQPAAPPPITTDRVTPAVAYQRLPKTGPAGTANHHYRDPPRPRRHHRHRLVAASRTACTTSASVAPTPAPPSSSSLTTSTSGSSTTTTGELLRHLTLNPDIDYQPLK